MRWVCHFSLQFMSLLTHRNAVTGHAHNEWVVLEVHGEVFNWSLFGSECIVSPCICNLQGMLLVTEPLLISFSEWERWGSFRLSLKWPLSNELRSHLGPIINELWLIEDWLSSLWWKNPKGKPPGHNPVASSKPSLTFGSGFTTLVIACGQCSGLAPIHVCGLKALLCEVDEWKECSK